MRVEEYAGPRVEWDRFVRAQKGWTHCHLFSWKAVLEGVFGHECIYLAAHRNGGDESIAGVLPLVRVKSLLFGHYLVSMPFLNYGGPLGDEAAVASLAKEAVARASRDGVTLLELRSRRSLDIPLSVSHRKIAVLLDLPSEDPEVLWNTLGSKVRSQVRRPEKEGVDVRFGHDQREPFYEVFSHHMRDLGTPCQPRILFETIAELFPDDAWFGCAYYRNLPVAGGCGFRWGGEFEMTWAAALREYSRMAPNMLLYWSFMERATLEGLSIFNFGRCTPGGGTHRFKRQWGSRDERLWWYYLANGERTAAPSPDESAFAWGPRIWRRIPLPLANALGPRIVRYIP